MRRFITLCTVLAFATGLCVVLRAGERPVEANIGTIPSGPHQPHKVTGFVGITAGQTARLHAINLGPKPVSVTLGILDGNGPVAVQGCTPPCPPDRVCQGQCVLQPGDEVSVEFNADPLNLGPGQRRPVRAVVSLSRGAQDVVPSFEIFDNETGRTSVLVTSCIVDMN